MTIGGKTSVMDADMNVPQPAGWQGGLRIVPFLALAVHGGVHRRLAL